MRYASVSESAVEYVHAIDHVGQVLVLSGEQLSPGDRPIKVSNFINVVLPPSQKGGKKRFC